MEMDRKDKIEGKKKFYGFSSFWFFFGKCSLGTKENT